MSRKAQATLEFALILIIVAALVVGLLGLWKWSKDNINGRQGAFEKSRKAAGQKATPGMPLVPFDAGSPGEPNYLSK